MRARENPCRVLFVDEDLLLAGEAAPLFSTGELSACLQHATYETALAAVRDHKPDILVVELAGGESFGAIEAVMAEAPTPILALRRTRHATLDPFQALGLGALEISELPDHPQPPFWRELARKLLLLSQVRVVRHVRGSRRRRAHGRHDAANEPPFPLVAIASSLGGPKALSLVLRSIPKAFPAPIVICQHISAGFTGGLAQWLAGETALKVVEARNGDWLTTGTVFIAPSGVHLLVTDDGRVRLDDGPPIAGFRPSCDALLTSAAQAFGRRCVGVVLTGMGRDGAKGLKEIRGRGGRTLVQDEATCVVYGMPGTAVELGAAEEILPLDEIAAAMIRLVEQC